MSDQMVVVTSNPEVFMTALIRAEVVEFGAPVLHPSEVEPDHVRGKIVVGSVPTRIAVAAAKVWEPNWAPTLDDRNRPEPPTADELLRRYGGFAAWRVQEVEDDGSQAR